MTRRFVKIEELSRRYRKGRQFYIFVDQEDSNTNGNCGVVGVGRKS